MANTPNLNPVSQTSRIVLTSTGSYSRVASACFTQVYKNSTSFITGAADQVSFTYRMLGGSVLDVEIEDKDVYSSYERAVLEYSYIINMHQARSSLGSFLGSTTGSFDSDGQITAGTLSGSNSSLKYPRFTIAYARKVGDEIGYEVGVGGTVPIFSASVAIVNGVQDYDLQSAVSTSAAGGTIEYANLINSSSGARIRVSKVWYKTPNSMWRFFGITGGLSTLGNLSTYGQYADDSTFEVIPAWQNKLQASVYGDNLYTRMSHYSYEIHNNKIRLFPIPYNMENMWFQFSLDPNPTEEYVDNAGNAIGGSSGIDGVNNINTLPFENIPFENINSIGKQWIRRYSLAVSKEILSQVRGKLATIPIPGNDITLNSAQLEAQALQEMDKLKEELKQQLEETTYEKISEQEANIVTNAGKTQQQIPKTIFRG